VTLLLISLAVLARQTPDTLTYADRATAELVEQARARHAYQDRLVRDYTALVRTRIDVALGSSRFARLRPMLAHETAARVSWGLPNDLKVDVVGQRGVSVFDEGDIQAAFDRPWFVPRTLGDSIHLVDDELPTTAALHPLAQGAESQYRYAIRDSVTLSLPGRTVHAIDVRVQPKGSLGPSLIAGDLWLDAQTAEIVRFTFVFVGEYLWETPDGTLATDSAEARKANVWASRIVTMDADLEYALYEERYWMPFRQLLQLTVEIPWFVNTKLPVRFVTSFEDYEVNRGTPPVFDAPPAENPDAQNKQDVDASQRGESETRCPGGLRDCDKRETGYYRVGNGERGGRWEVHYPPEDSLAHHVWPDALRLDLTADDEDRIARTIGELGELKEQLPATWVGRMTHGVAWESFADLFRFNRVQGVTIGAGYQIRPGPAFTTLMGRASFGLSDRRMTGSVTWRRDGPGSRVDISVQREVQDVEPWTSGLSFGNSMNAVFSAHDDADYLLALGGRVSVTSYGRGLLRNAQLELSLQSERNMVAVAGSGINDVLGGHGLLGANPSTTQGEFARFRITRGSRIAGVWFGQGVEAMAELRGGGEATRAWGDLQLPFRLLGTSVTVGGRAGYLVGDTLEQFSFRVGGPKTVRGFAYGRRRGLGFWSAQLDVALRDNALFAPVLWSDVGDVIRPVQTLSALDSGPLVAVGVGASIAHGLVRANLGKAVHPTEEIRFDLLFRAPR
jgi:hypothetical protein